MEARHYRLGLGAMGVSVGVVLALIACTRQPATATHTVAEYRANPDMRREQFARCANDPGTLGQTPDCINAREATRLEETRSMRQLPPVRLPPPPDRKK